MLAAGRVRKGRVPGTVCRRAGYLSRKLKPRWFDVMDIRNEAHQTNT